MSPRTGRPPSRGTTRDEILRVRVSEDERALIESAAARAGEPPALWMRDKLVAAAKRTARAS